MMKYTNIIITAFIALFISCANSGNVTVDDIQKACKNKQWDDVKKMCEDYIKKDKTNPIVYKALGDAYLAKDDSTVANYSYETAISIDSMYTDAIIASADILINSNATSYAIEMLNKAVDRMPDEAPLYNALGCAFRMKGDKNESQFYFEKSLKINPEYVSARRNLGVLYMANHEIEDAVLQFQTILDTHPSLADVHNYLGLAYVSLKEKDKAEEEFKTAIQCDPSYSSAYENLAYHYSTQNKMDLAKDAYEKAARLGSKNAQLILKQNKYQQIQK